MMRKERKNHSRGVYHKSRKKSFKQKCLILILPGFACVYLFLFAFSVHSTHVVLDNTQQNDRMLTKKDNFNSVAKTDTHYSQHHTLPKWIQDYLLWHQQMRAQFPGESLITDPNAPKILVRACLGLCGGLHDRLGNLPFDLYLANQTNRVLLIKWIKPQPLEEFLIPPPNGLDWVFPHEVKKGWGERPYCGTLNKCCAEVRDKPSIEGNVDKEQHDYIEMMEKNLYSLKHGELKDKRAVTYTIMSHLNEDWLEDRLKALGETDMIHQTESFGQIFNLFFTPHPNVQAEINSVYEEFGLIKHKYNVAHCRVRHPKAHPQNIKFGGKYIGEADKTGLVLEGEFKESAVRTAIRALDCAATLPGVADEKIYFMADESALVTYMTRDIVNNKDEGAESMDTLAKQVISKYDIVARDQNIPNAHIDKNKGRPANAYYATFVDLYLGINARCISFGVGNYALFASKISGTKCKIRSAKELWGEQETVHKMESMDCKLP